MKIPRFMKEYANYIKQRFLNGKSADVDNMLLAWSRGLIGTAEVMSTLASIERSMIYK